MFTEEGEGGRKKLVPVLTVECVTTARNAERSCVRQPPDEGSRIRWHDHPAGLEIPVDKQRR